MTVSSLPRFVTIMHINPTQLDYGKIIRFSFFFFFLHNANSSTTVLGKPYLIFIPLMIVFLHSNV